MKRSFSLLIGRLAAALLGVLQGAPVQAVPPKAFNTTAPVNDLMGTLGAQVLFAQSQVIPARGNADDPQPHLVGRRKALLMVRPLHPDVPEPLSVTVRDGEGKMLGTLDLDPPALLPRTAYYVEGASAGGLDFSTGTGPVLIWNSQLQLERLANPSVTLVPTEWRGYPVVEIGTADGRWVPDIYLPEGAGLEGKLVRVYSMAGYRTVVHFGGRSMQIAQGESLILKRANGQWFSPVDVENNALTYASDAWSGVLRAEWIQPGFSLQIRQGNATGELRGVAVGAPTQLLIHTIDIGMLAPPRGAFEFDKDLEARREYFQTIPAGHLIVSQYAPLWLSEVMMPTGTLLKDMYPGDGDWHSGAMRQSIGKELVSLGIDNANYGIHSTSGQGETSHPFLAAQLTAHNNQGAYANGLQVHGGSGGGGIVTLEHSVGNEFSHEVGHNYGLSHFGGGFRGSVHRGPGEGNSTWGWDADKNRLIPNFFPMKTGAVTVLDGESQAPFEGRAYGLDAMAGGEPLSSFNRYTLYTPYSASIIQRFLESKAVFDANSPTGFRRWNEATSQMEPYSHRVDVGHKVTAPIQGLTEAVLAALLADNEWVTVAMWDGNWTKEISLPPASANNQGRTVSIVHNAGYSSLLFLNGSQVTVPRGFSKNYVSNGSLWLEGPAPETSVERKPKEYGVPVVTLVGYYDPTGQLQSYIYPALHGAYGFCYGDDRGTLRSTDCYLEVETESGVLRFRLDERRLGGRYMNKFHVNVPESSRPQRASVVCGGRILDQKPITSLKERIRVTVTGSDIEPPVVQPRPTEIREATSPAGAVVEFAASVVTDNVDASFVDYSPASGSLFPQGDTEVTVTARDSAGNTSKGRFTVTVRDTTAPIITAVIGQRMVATSGIGGQGRVPDLTPFVSTSDAVGVVSVTQSPPVDTLRNAGIHSVALRATDAAGNQAETLVNVVMSDPVAIRMQPADFAVNTGQPVFLNVVAEGTGPIEYRWRKDGKLIQGATGASFRIDSVTESDSGIYDVVVGNVVGEVTSRAATVTVSSWNGLRFLVQEIQRLKGAPELSIPIGVSRDGAATGSAKVQVTVRSSSLPLDTFEVRDSVLSWNNGEIGARNALVVVKPGVEIAGGGETIELSLEHPFGAEVGELRTMVVKLRPLRPGTLMFTATTIERIKPISGDLKFEVVVARSSAATGAVSVDVVVVGGNAPVRDYVMPNPVRLSWADGDLAEKSFSIVYRGGLPVEGRTIVLGLKDPTGGALIGGFGTLTLAARSSAASGALGFAEEAILAAAPEGAERTVPVVVRRSLGAKGAVAVEVAVAGGSADAVTDYVLPEVRVFKWEDGDLADKTFAVRLRSTAQIAAKGETIVLKLKGQAGGAALGTAKTTITVLSSKAAPLVSICSPAAHRTFTGEGLVVRGTASDANGVARVEVAINGAPAMEATLAPAANGTTVDWMLALEPEDGANNIQVIAVDSLGNRSGEVVRGFQFRYKREDWVGVYDGLLIPEITLPQLMADYPGTAHFSSAFAETRGWGVLSVRVTASGAFSGRLLTGGVTAALKGVLQRDGTALFSSSRPSFEVTKGRGPARRVLGALTLRVNTSGEYPNLVGELAGTEDVIYGRFTAAKAIYSAARILPRGMKRISLAVLDPALENGRYTALFEPRIEEGVVTRNNLDFPAYPQASGYAVMTVARDGTMKLLGRLPDGMTISVGTRISPENTAPLYASLYGNRGCIAGTLRFDGTRSESDATAEEMAWFRPAGIGAPFAAGWPDGATVDLSASKYLAPAQPNKTVPFPSNPYSVFGSALPVKGGFRDTAPGSIGLGVHLAGAGLEGLIGNRVSVKAVNTITVLGGITGGTAVSGLKLAWMSKDGRFWGQFTHPVTQKTLVFGGVTFQKYPRAVGLFPGVILKPGLETQPGSVTIVPDK